MIDEIKKLDIKKVITDETNLSFKRNILEKCPLCGSGTGKNATSAFNVKNGYFRCFVCKKKGSAIDFIMQYKKMDLGPAIKYLAEKYNIAPTEQHTNKTVFTDFQKKVYAIKQNPKKDAHAYLRDARHLNPEKLPNNAFYYDTYSDAVVFFDEKEQLINKRLINPEKGKGKTKALMQKGSKITNALYTATYIKENDTVYLAEGVINALSLYQLQHSALAIFTTSNLFNDKNFLSKYLKNKNVVIALDPDEAGEKTAQHYIKFIQKNIETKNITHLNLTYRQDINDILKKGNLKKTLNNPDNYDYIKYPIATIPLRCNTNDIYEFELENKFYVKDSKYYQIFKKGEKESKFDVSDCVWSFLYRIIDGNGDATHLIKVQRYDREQNLIIRLFEANTDEIQKDKFEKKLNNIGFTFYGSATIFNKIKLFNLHRETEVKKVEKFGYHPEYNLFFWSNVAVTPDGTVLKPNEFGIVQHKKNAFYLETASEANINKRFLQELSKFKYKSGSLTLKQFVSNLIQAYDYKAVLAFSYFVSSIFRDIVFAELGRFPNLYLYGPPGTGKSKFAEFILAAQGDYTGGYGLTDTTQSSFSRIVDARINSLIYLKEYNSDVPTFVDEFLKTAYEGQGRTIGVKSSGNEVVSYQASTGILIDANFLPINQEAVFTRMIILDFKKTKFSKSEIEAYEILEDAQKKGLSQITTELLSIRKEFEVLFKNAFNPYFKEFKDKFPLLKDRAALHAALLYTSYQIIKKQFQLEIDDEKIFNSITEILETMQERQDSFSHSKLFWESFALGIKDGKIQQFNGEKIPYYGYFSIKEDKTFALRSADFKLFTQLYSKYCTDLKIKPLNPKLLKEELANKDYFLENSQKSRNTKYTHIDAALGSSYYFNTQNHYGNVIIIDNVEIEIN